MSTIDIDQLLPVPAYRAGDAEYDRASETWTRTGHPAVVVQPRSAHETAAAVAFARDNGLVLSVRSGGHSGSGHSTNDGGLVIDLSRLAEVEVLDDDLVRIGGGARWGAVAETLRSYDLALTSGDTASVGVGGLTLGGGIGWLVRQFGLAIDSLVEAEVVTSNGDILTANATDHADLFWALRGGGGNFGVVTSFIFRAHPLEGVHFGAIPVEHNSIGGLLRAWRDVMRAAPEELNSTFLAMPAMGDMPAGAQVLVCYAGTDDAAATAAIAPLLAIDGVTGSSVERMSYADVLGEPPHPPEGIRVANNNGFAADFDDDAVAALARVFENLAGSVLMIRYLRGAFNRVEPDATALAYRDSEVLVISAAFFPPDAPDEAVAAYNAEWATLLPHVQGLYGNFSALASDEATTLMYPPETLRRLREVKAGYDPGNLFDQNHNVRPAAPDWS
ncbi:FAD/FMN-containing dehydrogenase [Conyzicola lurida]|uniref:FAD/FMN-containing dehydrogenase n=1 Tax=Conyzicola lurida TaxID=1172621 RepID=A0A841AL43_9MICO|nr:FAD-binding oxidoreductase [Conyzicola lurida]MBB5843068.1 FAD/FMN-containing dehydrogenase [Conyzicola lurida]